MATSSKFKHLKKIAHLYRTDCYGEFDLQAGRGYRLVKAPVTDEVIRAHVENRQPIMLYTVVGDKTQVLTFDIDDHFGEASDADKAEVFQQLCNSLIADGMKPQAHLSGGGKGAHMSCYFRTPQSAAAVRQYGEELLVRMGLKSGAGGIARGEVEVFPKQDRVDAAGYGSGVALPFARASVPLDRNFQPVDIENWVPPSEEELFSSDEPFAATPPRKEASIQRAYEQVVLLGDLEEAESALQNVPADDYRLWIVIGIALKHAFRDDAFDLWVRWSGKSPKAGSMEELRRKWRSFKPRGNLSLGTIFYHAQQHGWNGPSHPLIRKYNARYGILTGGRQTLIIDKLAQSANDELLITLSKPTFQDRHASEKTSVAGKSGQPTMVPETTIWLQHALADHYSEIIFDPSLPPGRCGNAWNIWKGFAFTPLPGDWSLFKEHLLENIACGNQVLYQWLINWMAWAVQNPGSPIGTAAVFQGLPGTGKGVIARHFGAIWKPHVIEVTHQTHVSGNFNAHLFGRRLVFIDEGIFGGDKAKAGLIKVRITEPYFVVERKGVDAIRAPNRSIYMVASNNDQPVAADIGDRRWTMFNVSAKRKEDRPYFERIQQQMNNGGYAAMLYDLLHHDLRQGPDPQKNIRNPALFEQARRGMTPEENYVFGLLDEGRLPLHPGSESNQTSIDMLWNDFKATNPGAKFTSKVALGRTISKLLGDCITKRPHRPVEESMRQTKEGLVPAPLRSTEYTFAPLPECRRQYELHVGLPVEWSNDHDRWATGLPCPF